MKNKQVSWRKLVLAVVPALGLVSAVGISVAASVSKSFTASFSGTSVTVPLDVDGASCSSTPPFVCTDLSGYATYAGETIGGGSLASPFTGQSVAEAVPVTGTGCSINPTGWKSCTLGTVTDACEFTYDAAGGSFANRESTGDVAYGYIVGGTLCIDYNSAGGFLLPYKFSATQDFAIQGGTGKLTESTGSGTSTLSGQILTSDLQGHSFSWFTATSKGTTP